MKDAHSISTRRAYGVQRVCRVGTAPALACMQRRPTTSRAPCRRRGPVGAAPDDVLAATSADCSKPRPFTAKGTGKPAKLRGRGDPHLAGVRRLCAETTSRAPRGPRARPEGARRHDHHLRGPRCDVGHGHDGHSDRGRGR